jgi:hypothetical protein
VNPGVDEKTVGCQGAALMDDRNFVLILVGCDGGTYDRAGVGGTCGRAQADT